MCSGSSARIRSSKARSSTSVCRTALRSTLPSRVGSIVPLGVVAQPIRVVVTQAASVTSAAATVLVRRSIISVFRWCARYPPRQQAKTDCYTREKDPEPGEAPRVGCLCRIRNVAKRRKPRDRNTEAYDRENCGNNHGRLDGDFQMRLPFQERCLTDKVNRRRANGALAPPARRPA
jgi:hypothetical protein